ncbi:DedA family protein [Bacillus timonensis]|nr:DedA family protein [Bacillus timonensis]
MAYDVSLIVGEIGYIGLFLWLWIGIFGIPIPNELFVPYVGFAASKEVLHPISLFVTTYLGLIAGVTTSYLLGKVVEKPIRKRIVKRKHLNRILTRSSSFINRYKEYSLIVSYFIPGLRLMVPFLLGATELSFKKLMVISYPTVFVWTLSYFIIGLFAPQYIYLYIENEKIIYTLISIGFLSAVLLPSIMRVRVERKQFAQCKNDIA